MSCSYSASAAPERMDAKYGACDDRERHADQPCAAAREARALRFVVKPCSRTTRSTALARLGRHVGPAVEDARDRRDRDAGSARRSRGSSPVPCRSRPGADSGSLKQISEPFTAYAAKSRLSSSAIRPLTSRFRLDLALDRPKHLVNVSGRSWNGLRRKRPVAGPRVPARVACDDPSVEQPVLESYKGGRRMRSRSRPARSGLVAAAWSARPRSSPRSGTRRSGPSLHAGSAASRAHVSVMTGSGDPAFVRNFNPYTAHEPAQRLASCAARSTSR